MTLAVRVLIRCCVFVALLLFCGVANRGDSPCTPGWVHRGPHFRLEMGGTRSGMRNGEELTVFCDKQVVVRIKLKCADSDSISYYLEIPDGAAVKQDLFKADPHLAGKVIDPSVLGKLGMTFREIGTKPEVVLQYQYLFHVELAGGATFATVAVQAATWGQWQVLMENGKWILVRKIDKDIISSLRTADNTSAVGAYIGVQHNTKDDGYYMDFRVELPWPPLEHSLVPPIK